MFEMRGPDSGCCQGSRRPNPAPASCQGTLLTMSSSVPQQGPCIQPACSSCPQRRPSSMPQCAQGRCCSPSTRSPLFLGLLLGVLVILQPCPAWAAAGASGAAGAAAGLGQQQQQKQQEPMGLIQMAANFVGSMATGAAGQQPRNGARMSEEAGLKAAGGAEAGAGAAKDEAAQPRGAKSSATWETYWLHQASAAAIYSQCVNQQYEPKKMTWEDAMDDKLASLRVAGSWWSKRQANLPVTVATQLSANRLNQLAAQCKMWSGPLSAVVYVPLLQEVPQPLTRASLLRVQEAAMMTAELHAAMEASNGCGLDISVVYEVVTEPRAAALLYPVNQLRNLARLQARTPLIAQLDVDMLVSNWLVRWLGQDDNAQHMVQACKQGAVYVLPAFETYGPNTTIRAAVADELAAKSKASVVRAVTRGYAAPFDSRRFPQGHNVTNFDRWYTTESEYEVKYGYRYEPWVIVHRQRAPWHDVRFRGYGNNKIQQIAHLNSTGYKFIVHPVAFIVHRSHQETSARFQMLKDLQAFSAATNKMALNKTLYGHNRILFDKIKAQMDVGKFSPVVDPATSACAGKLPWWSGSPAAVAKADASLATSVGQGAKVGGGPGALGQQRHGKKAAGHGAMIQRG